MRETGLPKQGLDIEGGFNESEKDTTELEAEKKKKGSKAVSGILGRMAVWGMVTVSALTAMKENADAIERKSKDRQQDATENVINLEADPVELPPEFFSPEQSDFLELHLGEDVTQKIQQRIFIQKMNQEGFSEGVEKKEWVIKNFEALGISSEAVEQLCHTYPRNWVDTEVDSILYDDEVQPMPAEYGRNLASESTSAATAERKMGGATKITFHAGADSVLPALNKTLAHEFGHANDWWADNSLSSENKRQLLVDVLERYTTGEKIYVSDYVESIQNEDAYTELELKITEYWAEICMQYFDNPTFLKDYHPADYELVDKYVKFQDPDFDPVKAAGERRTYYKEYERDKVYSQYPDAVREKLLRVDSEISEQRTQFDSANVEFMLNEAGDAEVERYWEATRQLNDEVNELNVQKYFAALTPEAQQRFDEIRGKYRQIAQECLTSRDKNRLDTLSSLYDEDLTAFNSEFSLHFDNQYLRDAGWSILNNDTFEFYLQHKSEFNQ